MTQGAKKIIKRTLSLFVYYSGVAWVSLALALRHRAVVLMYHRVLADDWKNDAFSADSIVVTRRTFERHMRFLRRFCNPVTIQQFSAMVHGRTPWPPRACLVTFDDGWFDSAEHALPILERWTMPASVFVATAFIDTANTFWQERLTRLLFKSWKLGRTSQPLFEELSMTNALSWPEARARRAFRDLANGMKSGPRAAVTQLIIRLERHLRAAGIDPSDIGDDRFMSWNQASALARSGLVAVESHAHTHTPLTALDKEAVAEELARSRSDLAARLGVATRFLAYPNGDYDATVAAVARESGFELAFTTEPGYVSPGDDPHRLKRINFMEEGTTSESGFICRLLGWW